MLGYVTIDIVERTADGKLMMRYNVTEDLEITDIFEALQTVEADLFRTTSQRLYNFLKPKVRESAEDELEIKKHEEEVNEAGVSPL